MTDQDLAALLLDAHKTGAPLQITPPVADAPQAYRVQRLVMDELGEIGGWKVGAPTHNGPLSCAPLPSQTILTSPAVLDSATFTQRDVESEICFVLAHDMPPRAAPYTREEAIAAIASCHPGIEILQSRYAFPDAAPPVALLADLIQTGAYVVGAPIANWHPVISAPLTVRQTSTNRKETVVEAAANPGGDMIRMIRWLADEGAVWAGGIKAGQVVTCGSWTGKTKVAPGTTVFTAFHSAPTVEVAFTPLSQT